MRFSLLALALTASGLVAQERQKPKADLILYGGVVYRGGETPAQAVAVRGNLILAVGGTESMLELRGPKTRVIPLRGRLVVPGFNDNHVHFASAARFLEFNIMTTTTQAEFVERVKDVVSRVPKGEWITGGFWGAYENWTQGSATATKRKSFTPNMSLVEEITKNHPMLIQRFDRGEWAANRIALKSIGHRIDLDTAVRAVLRCSNRCRLPEPIRAADRLAGTVPVS